MEIINIKNHENVVEVKVNTMYLNNCGKSVVVIGTDHRGEEVTMWYDNIKNINLCCPDRIYADNGELEERIY